MLAPLHKNREKNDNKKKKFAIFKTILLFVIIFFDLVLMEWCQQISKAIHVKPRTPIIV